MSHDHFTMLQNLRKAAGPARTKGLDDEIVKRFSGTHPDLGKAIEAAARQREELGREYGDWFRMEEGALCALMQERLLNFYPAWGINPYVPLAAAGPWIVTSHGAVLHDTGGYGMLGLGHAPQKVLDAMSRPYVMANVMTPAFSQKRLTDRLTKEIGHTRRAGCPYSRFVCLNSGSESVTFACRVTDIHAKRMTDPGAPQAGRTPAKLAAIEGFHGRTEGPARLSHSTRAMYLTHLASFRHPDRINYIPFNDLEALRAAFAQADRDGIFFEAVYLEPVMGEGIPGLALNRAFYDEARQLSRKMGSLLVIDSIQAALRAQGCLSIVDYPGFEDCDPPDMETYSKALNAGQYPLSVIALRDEVAKTYVQGLYGNTMTTNPRALEVACEVLDSVTPEVRNNIRDRGTEFLRKFLVLAGEFPGTIDQVVGTGLMVSVMLNPEKYKVTGKAGFEEWLRLHGIEMIHGGEYGLRFTPSFSITSAEVDLIVEMVRRGLKELGGK